MHDIESDDVIDWSTTPRDELRFAFGLDLTDRPGDLVSHEIVLRLRGTPTDSRFNVRFENGQVAPVFTMKVEVQELVDVRFHVEAPAPDGDDELELDLVEDGSTDPLPIRIRRTRCRIETALIHPRPGGDPGRFPLGDHVRAALLWYGWNRCTRLVGIKRFDSGLSDSEVLVFRPRLAAPRLDPRHHDTADFAGSIPPELWTESWGAWFLVKAGGVRQVRKEWSRHDVFLRDRLTPFMARTETMLRIRPARRAIPSTSSTPVQSRKKGESVPSTDVGPSRGRATLISSFVGGDLIRAEPLEFRLKGGSDPASCRSVLARAFETLNAWHRPGHVADLRHYGRFFKFSDGKLRLFGPKLRVAGGRLEQGYDLADGRHREIFGRKVTWDVAFQRSEHLGKHLVGSNRDGLLYRLMETKVRYSLIHGDLNPRNVLCDREYAWLIDFEHAGYGPTLFDFAWLEANLRFFCLNLAPAGEGLDEAATLLERHLLDHLHGGESSVEPVRQWAAEMGADPDDLYRLADAIVQVRQLAMPYCVDEYADHRDYLAVLYLSVLSLLRGDRRPSAPPANYRALVRLGWVLEEQLSRIHGLEPFDSGRASPDPRQLIDAEWLRAPGAPGRVNYLVRSADGARVLGPVAATRGVHQSEYHHLDVFDHTLSVLAYVEGLFEGDDPIAGLLDPDALEARVTASLEAQGLRFPPGVSQGANGSIELDELDERILAMARESLREALGEAVAGPGRLLVKWCALIHDVGKPGVRSMTTDGRIHVIGHPDYGLQLLEGHIATWFDEEQADRLRNLILRHHDHNNLAKNDHDAVANLDDLARFVLDPLGASYQEFERLWSLAEAVISRRAEGSTRVQGSLERRMDFPLLILHGFADSLASRGHHYPMPLGRRARIYLVFLAVWNRRDHLTEIHKEWRLCEDRAKEKRNPNLHQVIFLSRADIDQERRKILGQLPEWAWNQVQTSGKCPQPEEFVEEARRRIGEMT